MKLNPAALEKARIRIAEGDYRLNHPWRTIQPSPEAGEKFAAQHGMAAYGEWFLAIDPAQPADSPSRYILAVGDFRNIHNTALLAARDQAARANAAEVSEAIEELLELFDRMNAC